jgi:copper transport protein
MRRAKATLVLFWLAGMAGLTLVGPAAPAAIAHSQLVTSEPAAGSVLASAPTEIRLVFSEAISAAYTSLDLLDADGRTLKANSGQPDPHDPYSLVAPIGPLADGVFTVQWRALSAADGHTTNGFFTFGIGSAAPGLDATSSSTSGSIHSGHDAATSLLETESRVVGDLGLMLGFGLPVIGSLVVRRPQSTGIAKAATVALVLGGIGSFGLVVLGAMSTGLDLLTFAVGSRPGLLLVARGVLLLAAAFVAMILLRRSPHVSSLAAGSAGLLAIVLLTIGSHAAAYSSPAPLTVGVVHVAAAGIWLSGLVVLVARGWGAAFADLELAQLVPRFSGLALVSVGLIVATGAYADWLETRSLISLTTPYGATLAVKVALVETALIIGARNYLTGVDARIRFARRVTIESLVALAVVIVTGVLASGSPPAQELPVSIAPAGETAGTGTTLSIAPGRPGPTRFIVSAGAIRPTDTVILQLQRLDGPGSTHIELKRNVATATYESGGGLLTATSQWNATVIVIGADHVEISRTRFAFGVDTTGIDSGRAGPLVDVGLAVAVALLALAAVALAYSIGGGVLPRVDRAVGRGALFAGCLVAIVLGSAILISGPRL